METLSGSLLILRLEADAAAEEAEAEEAEAEEAEAEAGLRIAEVEVRRRMAGELTAASVIFAAAFVIFGATVVVVVVVVVVLADARVLPDSDLDLDLIEEGVD